jgi:hypothetical protein
MTTLGRQLAERAAGTDRPLASLIRQHILDGLLRRLGHSSQASSFLLRGGLLTRAWLGPQRRTTDDADFLGLFPRDVEEALGRLGDLLASPLPVEDEVHFLPATLAGRLIWEETPFPGVRISLCARALDAEQVLQIDVGFDDPVVPPPVWLDFPTLLPGALARVLTCRPETLVGWKLHGLFEHGARRWRAKDLHDLDLLTRFLTLDDHDLTDAIRVAFASRDQALTEIPGVLYNRSWWTADKARQRWEKFRTMLPAGGAVDDLAVTAERVGRRLRGALEAIVELPRE